MNTGPIHPRASRTIGAPILGAACFLAVAAGFLALWIYKTRPGAEGTTAARNWPGQSRIHANAGKATLLLFAHPRCACTRARISELAGVSARFHGAMLTAYLGKPYIRLSSWVKACLIHEALRQTLRRCRKLGWNAV